MTTTGGANRPGFPMQILRNTYSPPAEQSKPDSFRQRCASALMHPATLGALGVLLANDLVFKALWPGARTTGEDRGLPGYAVGVS